METCPTCGALFHTGDGPPSLDASLDQQEQGEQEPAAPSEASDDGVLAPQADPGSAGSSAGEDEAEPAAAPPPVADDPAPAPRAKRPRIAPEDMEDDAVCFQVQVKMLSQIPSISARRAEFVLSAFRFGDLADADVDELADVRLSNGKPLGDTAALAIHRAFMGVE